MNDLVETMSPIVKTFFSVTADAVAYETGFVQRRSKMTGAIFLKTLVFGFFEQATTSLHDLAAFCADHCGVQITPQGLDDRIHDTTISFMQAMCTQAFTLLRQTLRLPVALVEQFSAINLTDSTVISLPESLATDFPGCGGDAAAASVKIQTVLDLLTGAFQRVWLTPGKAPDQTVREHLDLAQPGSLNLFDLGYWGVDRLRVLAERSAFFLCRFFPSTNLYHPTGAPISLLKLLRQCSASRFELPVCLGKHVRLPCRLCAFRAPAEVAKRRRQHATRRAAKHGSHPAKRSLALLGWTLFVTNVPSTRLSLAHIGTVYAARWQIELVFKLWKSHMHLDRIAGSRQARVLVELYAKLIGLMLFHFLSMPVRATDLNLSPTKAFRRVVNAVGALVDALGSLRRLKTVIARLQEAILHFAKREKRTTRLTTFQQLLLEVDYYA